MKKNISYKTSQEDRVNKTDIKAFLGGKNNKIKVFRTAKVRLHK